MCRHGTGWGPQDSIQLVHKWLNSMVYGRYNELVNGDYFMVYKPTFTSLGGPILYLDVGYHPIGIQPHHANLHDTVDGCEIPTKPADRW